MLKIITRKITSRIRKQIHDRKFRKDIVGKILEVDDAFYIEKWGGEIDWLRKNGYSGGKLKQIMFPYEWVDEYENKVEVSKDNSGYNYSIITDSCGKSLKLYFYKTWFRTSVRPHYRNLLIEQDKRSPHCYCNDKFPFPKDTVLLDIGCAEASFTLMHIHEIKHAFIFERDKKWIDVLDRTFAPYKDKVTIIQKYVGGSDERDTISLDSFYETLPEMYKTNLFIKMDIEGAELEALNHAKHIINDSKCCTTFSICTYHRHDDYANIPLLFDETVFQTGFSDGWMIVDASLLGYSDNSMPYFRRGVFHARRIRYKGH